MNAQEHKAKAEALMARSLSMNVHGDEGLIANTLRLAKVHALLANVPDKKVYHEWAQDE